MLNVELVEVNKIVGAELATLIASLSAIFALLLSALTYKVKKWYLKLVGGDTVAKWIPVIALTFVELCIYFHLCKSVLTKLFPEIVA